MRIAYLHQYFNTPSQSGSSRTYELAKQMANRGHDVHIITSDRSHTAGAGQWTTTMIEGFTVHSVGNPYNSSYAATERISSFLRFAFIASPRARAVNADIVFATSTPLTIAIPGLFATLFRRTPLVLEIRDLWPDIPIALGYLQNPLMRIAARTLELISYRYAAHIIALSPGMKDGIRRRGIAENHISVIPNAADIAMFDTPAKEIAAWRAEQTWLGDSPLVTHCGAIGHVNGVEYLVHLAAAAHELDPSIKFAAIGEGPRRQQLIELATTAGVLNRNFFVLDPAPKHQMPAIFGASTISTVLVIPVPELQHNSANKFFDTLAARRPVAINYGGWQAELIRKHEVGLTLSPTDPVRSAHQVVDLINDADLLRTTGESARTLAHQFDRTILSRELIDILEHIAKTRTRASRFRSRRPRQERPPCS